MWINNIAEHAFFFVHGTDFSNMIPFRVILPNIKSENCVLFHCAKHARIIAYPFNHELFWYCEVNVMNGTSSM